MAGVARDFNWDFVVLIGPQGHKGACPPAAGAAWLRV